MSPPQSQPSTPRPEARAPLGTRKDCVAATVAGRHCRSPDGGLRGHSWPDMGLPTVPGLLLPLVRRGGAQRSGQAGEGRLGLGRVEGRARPQACAGLPSHTAPLTRGPELGTSLKGQEGNGPRPGQAGNVVAGAHRVRRGSLLGNRCSREVESSHGALRAFHMVECKDHSISKAPAACSSSVSFLHVLHLARITGSII